MCVPVQSSDHGRQPRLGALPAPPPAAIVGAAGRSGAVHLPRRVLMQPWTPRGGLLVTRPNQAAARSAAQHSLPQPVV